MSGSEGSNPRRGHQPRLPRWIRAVLSVDRVAHEAVRVESALRDEILWAWTAPEARDEVTAAVFSTQGTYMPGGALHARGLFAWERVALSSAPFAACHRWLIGGAGGGRELFAMMDLGHTVLAFEPCEALCQSARAELAGSARGEMRRASYADLVRAAQGLGGVLSDVAAWGPDAVILGWGSFSHVQTAQEREGVLKAVRIVAPKAMILLSFLPRSESSHGPVAAARRAVHRLARSLGAPGTLSAWTAGRGFIPTGGFVARMTEAEVGECASRAGYLVERCVMEPYPHAVLRPFERQ